MKISRILLLCLLFATLNAQVTSSLRVGAYENAPRIYTGADGQLRGFWYELTEHISEKEGWKLTWVPGTWGECLDRLERNEIDIMVDVAYTPERAGRVLFQNEIVILSWTRIYIRKGTAMENILDLDGKDVAVMKGSFNVEGPEGLKHLMRQFGIDCHLIELTDYREVFEHVDRGAAFAGVVNKDFGALMENEYDVSRTPVIFQAAQLKYACAPDSPRSPGLINTLDHHIRLLKSDNNSTYYMLMDKYFGESERNLTFPLWLKITLPLLIFFVLLFLTFTWLLRKQVKNKILNLKKEIRERKEAENDLLYTKHFLNNVLESVQDGISVLDTDLTVRHVNSVMKKWYDLNTPLEGKKCYEVYHNKKEPCDPCPTMRCITSGKTEHLVHRGLPGSSAVWIELYSYPMKDPVSGKVTGVVEFVRDITHQKKAEEQLHEALEKATESDRLKSAFLANISHEIRTPMNGILGFTHLLQKETDNPETRSEYLRIIENSSVRLMDIINDLVDIAKIESGQMPLHMEKIDIHQKMKDLYAFFQPQAEDKGLHLGFDCHIDGPERYFECDRDKLYSILANLIRNAIKYTVKGYVEFTCEKKGENVEFYVKDSGKGIPEEKQKHIFERFIRLDQEESEFDEGVGLGLPITKAYVEMLGGEIGVTSTPGEGSCFRFTIPCKEIGVDVSDTPLENKHQSDEDKKQIPKLDILIAEDDDFSFLYLQTLLRDHAGQILQARTGREAVDLCREHPELDLLLLDVRMPVMDGYEAAQKIREFNKDIIIIAQTAHAFTEDRDKVIDAGCNDYISKPILDEKLFSLLERYFSSDPHKIKKGS
jgi:PAS domain S-box-containing protein